jgi:hypothetical protein
MIAKDTSGEKKDRTPIPAGMQIARCYGVFDKGTHHDERFGKDKRELVITWEVPKHRISFEKDGVKKDLPRAISKSYTLSLHEKSGLRKDLQSWRGRAFTEAELGGFAMKNILGKPCLLNITHVQKDGKTYANIGAITPLMEGMTCPPQENANSFFSFDEYDSRDLPFPEGMPPWVQDEAKKSKEWAALGDVQPDAEPETEESEPETSEDESLPF